MAICSTLEALDMPITPFNITFTGDKLLPFNRPFAKIDPEIFECVGSPGKSPRPPNSNLFFPKVLCQSIPKTLL